MRLEHITQEPTTRRYDTPILFIHGAWHGAWCWQEYFMPHFADQGFTVHALSLRNHGQSENHGSIRWRRGHEYVADVHQIVQEIGTPPILIGHSMGGYVVQKYLEKHTVPAAVLVAPCPSYGVIGTSLRIALRHPLAFLKTNVQMHLWPIIETPELMRDTLFPKDMPQEKVNSYFARMQDESYLGFLDMLILNLPHPKRVTPLPMLIVGGESDTTFTPQELTTTAKAYNATLKMFPGVAHDMMLDPQWHAIAETIAAWIKSQSVKA
jgi:pimeloyl-ACP methyl ester carboxylesterase